MYASVYEQIDKAMSWIQSGKVNEGLSLLQELLQHAYGDPDLLLALADVFYELGHADTALALLKDIEPYLDEITTDMQIDIRTLRSEILIDLGHLDDAMDELHQCVDLEPDYTRASILLADIYLMQNLPEVSCRYLEDVLDLEPEEHDVRFVLIQIYLDMGEWEKASEHMAELNGTEYEGRLSLSKARLLGQVGKFEEAYILFQESLRKEESEEALFGCALTALQFNQVEEAIGYAKALNEKNTDHVGAFQILSEALVKSGKIQEAKEALRQAYARNVQEESIILKLIELEFQSGDLDRARSYADELLDLNNEHELAMEWKERLSQM